MDANLKKALLFLAAAIVALMVLSFVWAMIKALFLPVAILALFGMAVYGYFRFYRA